MSLFDNIFKNPKEVIYPQCTQIFRALELCPIRRTKVVILGQDPYHGEGQANGLAFSVNKGIVIPPSLRNIFKELHSDLGVDIPTHGDLTCWAEQGVLLLNSVLTVVKDQPMSHAGLGWESYTDAILARLGGYYKKPVAFLLLGKKAQEKRGLITKPQHLVIETSHPSPFSARLGFFGSKPFSRVNEFLIANNNKPIDWRIK